MMKKFSVVTLLNLLLLFELTVVAARTWQGRRVLVLLDDLSLIHSHSTFFSHLRERGYKLTFFLAEDPTLTLQEFGEYLYDHLILFSPSVEEFGGLVDVASILEFIDTGHNVILVGDSALSDPIRELASECGIEFDEEGSYVYDHLNHAESETDDPRAEHNVLALDPEHDINARVKKTPILRSVARDLKAPILYKGIGHQFASPRSPSRDVTVLFGSPLSYSDKSVDHPASSSSTHSLVRAPLPRLISTLQARNNARILVVGSLAFFSDRFFTAPVHKVVGTEKKSWEVSGNAPLAYALTAWTLHEHGVLRVSNVTHHRKGESLPSAVYRIKDELVYEVDLEEWDSVTETWKPYVADDVQVEYVRLDPHIRTTLVPVRNKPGHYVAAFQIPDVYGIFSIKLNYTRLGYTAIYHVTTTPVRPFRHNEFERFIDSAYPYYASAISMVVGVFLLSLVLLYSREKR
jgi:oligosaccharyltransferase complex subunit beta